jgi:ABC-type transport system substrate-binding protein
MPRRNSGAAVTLPRRILLPSVLLLVALTGCGDRPWNDPYAGGPDGGVTLYSSFEERPKHLDPARSYSSNEQRFIAQIYEPPLQYHYLKRPYELVPLTAAAMPTVTLLGADGQVLAAGAATDEVAFSEYEIRIRPGIRYQPHPALARSPDGTLVYESLDPAVRERARTLSDFTMTGTRELTADDYVYQIKRLAYTPLHSPIAGLMGGYIVGFDAFAKDADAALARLREATGAERPWLDLRSIDMAGVRAVDRYTYRVRLKGQYPQFRYWLAMPFFAPTPWEADRFHHLPGLRERNITLDWYPVGTGPFLLAENNPNLRMVLERNPHFHGERYPTEGMPDDAADGLLADAGRPLPMLDRAVYSLEKETIPRWNKFLQGYYDGSGIASDSFDQAVQFGAGGEAALTDAMRARGIGLVTSVDTSIFYFGFNMKDPVVGGDSESARLLRRAIAIALDFEEYVSIFLNGRGLPAQGILPPGIFGHRDGAEGVNTLVYDPVDDQPRRRPLDEARALLAAAGYPDGIDRSTGRPLVLNYDTAATGPDSKAQLDWYRKQFDKLGVQLVVRATDYNRFQEKMLKGTAQMFSWGWNADYPDPENFFFLLYGPHGKVDHGGENAANYANARFDELFDRMKNIADGPERQALIDEMNEVLRHDGPWVWGYHPKGYTLHHAWYRNIRPNQMANNTLKYLAVDPVLRVEKQREWNRPRVWPVVLLVAMLGAIVVPAVAMHRRRERSAAR